MEGSIVRILVVDDYEPWRRFLRSILQGQPNLQIIGEVSDGFEAVRRAQRLQPDLILIDIGLQSLNGIEAARRIHESVPTAKILFASGDEGPGVVDAALNNGAHGYILKSDAASELLHAVESMISNGKFVSRRLVARNSE